MRPGGPRWIFLGWLQHLPTSFAYKNRFARISFYKPYITRFMLLSCSRHNRGDEAQQAARLRHRASLGGNAAHRRRSRYTTRNSITIMLSASTANGAFADACMPKILIRMASAAGGNHGRTSQQKNLASMRSKKARSRLCPRGGGWR